MSRCLTQNGTGERLRNILVAAHSINYEKISGGSILGYCRWVACKRLSQEVVNNSVIFRLLKYGGAE